MQHAAERVRHRNRACDGLVELAPCDAVWDRSAHGDGWRQFHVCAVRRRVRGGLGDACRDPRVAVTVDDEVAGRNGSELGGAAEAEPGSAAIGPCAAMRVTCVLDQILADRDAYERRGTVPWGRVSPAESIEERGIVEVR